MLALKYLLVILSLGIFAAAAGIVGYDVYRAMQLNWLLARKRKEGQPGTEALSRQEGPFPLGPVRWRQALPLVVAGLVPILLALSIVVVPDGSVGIRVNQFSVVRPGALYSGMHPVAPPSKCP